MCILSCITRSSQAIMGFFAPVPERYQDWVNIVLFRLLGSLHNLLTGSLSMSPCTCSSSATYDISSALSYPAAIL